MPLSYSVVMDVLVLLYLFVTCWFDELLNTVLITPVMWQIYEPYALEATFDVVRFASLCTKENMAVISRSLCYEVSKEMNTLLTRVLFTLNYARERILSHQSYKHTTVKLLLNGIFLQRKGFQYLVVSFHAGFTVFHDLYRHVKKGQTQSPVSWCRTGLEKTRPFF